MQFEYNMAVPIGQRYLSLKIIKFFNIPWPVLIKSWSHILKHILKWYVFILWQWLVKCFSSPLRKGIPLTTGKHMHMHTSTHARNHAHTHARNHARTHACTQSHTHACMHACMHARTHT